MNPDVSRQRPLSLLSQQTPQIMGVLNVTPDSFSDGGEHEEEAQGLARARLLFREGATVVDIGGESTAPGSTAVSSDLELERD